MAEATCRQCGRPFDPYAETGGYRQICSADCRSERMRQYQVGHAQARAEYKRAVWRSMSPEDKERARALWRESARQRYERDGARILERQHARGVPCSQCGELRASNPDKS